MSQEDLRPVGFQVMEREGRFRGSGDTAKEKKQPFAFVHGNFSYHLVSANAGLENNAPKRSTILRLRYLHQKPLVRKIAFNGFNKKGSVNLYPQFSPNTSCML